MQESESSLKPWPVDCVQIVAATYQTVNLAGIRGRVLRRVCNDCQSSLGVDSETIDDAIVMKERNGRPLRYICVECCLQYDRCSIDHFVDQRMKSNSENVNEGVLLDDSNP